MKEKKKGIILLLQSTEGKNRTRTELFQTSTFSEQTKKEWGRED